MRRQYDFSKSRTNPYVHRLKKQVTIRLDPEVLDYFKHLTDETAIPYQTLINLYLRDCATKGRRVKLHWPRKKAA